MLYKFQRMEIALKMLSIKHVSIFDLMLNTTTQAKIKVNKIYNQYFSFLDYKLNFFLIIIKGNTYYFRIY